MSAPRHPEADGVLRDGSTVHVRPVRAEDAPAVRAFFERLSPESIALRFFSGFPDLDRAVRWATDVEDQHRYGLVATSSADGRVVAHAGWETRTRPPRTRRGRLRHRRRHPAQRARTILVGQLIEAADQASVAVLSAEVLPRTTGCSTCFTTAASRSPPAPSRAWSWWNCPRRCRRALRTPRAALEQAPFGEGI